jgi:zinc-binding alcohol dehydrogenase/oxidoreductase
VKDRTSALAKALYLKSAGNIEIGTYELPDKLKDGQALIKINAAALNRRDLWIKQGKYAKIRENSILGSDGCGVVVSVSDYEYSEFKDAEVIINPNQLWGDNEKSQSEEYTILGMPSPGTFSEYLIVEEDRLILKPKHLSSTQAAALPLAGLTAYRATFTQGCVEKGTKVLITGVGGGVSQFVLQFCLAVGAEVYVTSSSDKNIKSAIKAGAKGGVNYKEHNWAKQLKDQFGAFEVAIDSAGGDGLNSLISLANYGGTIVSYGATAGAPNKLNIQSIFWKQIRLLGSTMGSDRDFTNMVEFVDKYKIVPTVDSVRPFSKIISAFDDMENGKVKGKLVIEMD